MKYVTIAELKEMVSVPRQQSCTTAGDLHAMCEGWSGFPALATIPVDDVLVARLCFLSDKLNQLTGQLRVSVENERRIYLGGV